MLKTELLPEVDGLTVDWEFWCSDVCFMPECLLKSYSQLVKYH